jgi:hypothetical protein
MSYGHPTKPTGTCNVQASREINLVSHKRPLIAGLLIGGAILLSNHPAFSKPNSSPDEPKEAYGPDVVSHQRALMASMLLGGSVAYYGLNYYMESATTSSDGVEKAEAKRDELVSGESRLMAKYGGETFSMKRLPGMEELHPNIRGNVYIRIPEKADTQHVVVFLHGNGGQQFVDKNGNLEVNIKNMVECTDRLKLPLIAPQDGWAGTEPEKKGWPGNWKGFINPQLGEALIRFYESKTGKSTNHISVATFSGGNIGLSKWLSGMENNSDFDAKRLYRRIKQVALFDSADGQERNHVAKWMHANSDAYLFSCFNENGDIIYKSGNNLLEKALAEKKIDPNHKRIIPISANRAAGHGVNLKECQNALEQK